MVVLGRRRDECRAAGRQLVIVDVQRDGAALDVDGDLIAVLDQRDRAAGCGFGADVADARASRMPGPPAGPS